MATKRPIGNARRERLQKVLDQLNYVGHTSIDFFRQQQIYLSHELRGDLRAALKEFLKEGSEK